jgi:hypothetical protein
VYVSVMLMLGSVCVYVCMFLLFQFFNSVVIFVGVLNSITSRVHHIVEFRTPTNIIME